MKKIHEELMNMLLKRKKELLEAESSMTIDKIGDSDMGHGDEMDIAESNIEQEMSMTMRYRSTQELQQISEALEKLHKGEYGECESCGEAIESKRLKAKPYVKYCINCQEEVERNSEESPSSNIYKFGKTD